MTIGLHSCVRDGRGPLNTDLDDYKFRTYSFLIVASTNNFTEVVKERRGLARSGNGIWMIDKSERKECPDGIADGFLVSQSAATVR